MSEAESSPPHEPVPERIRRRFQETREFYAEATLRYPRDLRPR